VQDLKHPDRFESKLRDLVERHNAELASLGARRSMRSRCSTVRCAPPISCGR
jgi:hypothetical protein